MAERVRPRRLPGDPEPRRVLERTLRVDQAGEYGAIRIYEGQIAVLKGTAAEPVLRGMLEQERTHLETFNAMLPARRVRPTALHPLWHMLGYAMGAGTALLGTKAAMACTVAVEAVIDGHYRNQAEALDPREKDLLATVARFREDEVAHGEEALAHGARGAPVYPLLTAAIRGMTRLAIKASERV